MLVSSRLEFGAFDCVVELLGDSPCTQVQIEPLGIQSSTNEIGLLRLVGEFRLGVFFMADESWRWSLTVFGAGRVYVGIVV